MNPLSKLVPHRSLAAAGLLLFAATTQAAGLSYGPRNTVPDPRAAVAVPAEPPCGPVLRLAASGPRPRYERVEKYMPCAASRHVVIAPGYGPRNQLRRFN